MNLEEKIKEIEYLCQNLDESNFYLSRSLTNKSIYFIGMHDLDDFSIFDINCDNSYNALINNLKKNQKQPDLYTLDEIFKIEHKWYVNYNDSKNNLDRVEYIKKHAKPYKKLD